MNVIELTNVKKDYPLGATTVHALRGLCLGVGMTVGSCILAVVDSFIDGLADSLLDDET